jgi:hypothetical protein
MSQTSPTSPTTDGTSTPVERKNMSYTYIWYYMPLAPVKLA